MSALVLYIEDNPDNMTLVRCAIEAIGVGFAGAETGAQGLRDAENMRPDIILLDINLPDMNGYDVARRLRASSCAHLRYVPVIALTGNAYKGDVEKAIEAGCDIFMTKPINIRELWARVEGLLEITTQHQ